MILPPITLETPILTQSEAAARNLTVYWSGTICCRGHKSYRYTSCAACVACHRERARPAAATANQRRADRLRHIETRPVRAHSDDVAALEWFAAQLLVARGLG